MAAAVVVFVVATAVDAKKRRRDARSVDRMRSSTHFRVRVVVAAAALLVQNMEALSSFSVGWREVLGDIVE